MHICIYFIYKACVKLVIQLFIVIRHPFDWKFYFSYFVISEISCFWRSDILLDEWIVKKRIIFFVYIFFFLEECKHLYTHTVKEKRASVTR